MDNDLKHILGEDALRNLGNTDAEKAYLSKVLFEEEKPYGPGNVEITKN